jgi:saccharopine dehydrogenase (NAD+, L-lysine-forming)
MKTKTILILGGYGGTGRVVSRLLLKETDVDIIIAGRSINKAE